MTSTVRSKGPAFSTGALVSEKARAEGRTLSQVVTDEAQLVTEGGDVIMHGRVVGHTEPHRPGGGAAWDAWGLEAARGAVVTATTRERE